MKLYHATNNRYETGNDLLSLAELWNQGFLTEEECEELVGRWEAGSLDDYISSGHGQQIALTSDREEAERVLAEFNGGKGVILVIDGDALEADGLLRKNDEGYPAVWDTIPASYLLTEQAT